MGMPYASPANMGGLQTIAPAQSSSTFVNANPAMGQLTSSFQVGTTAPVIAQPGQPIRFLDSTSPYSCNCRPPTSTLPEPSSILTLPQSSHSPHPQ